jgi:hypothetical protein
MEYALGRVGVRTSWQFHEAEDGDVSQLLPFARNLHLEVLRVEGVRLKFLDITFVTPLALKFSNYYADN